MKNTLLFLLLTGFLIPAGRAQLPTGQQLSGNPCQDLVALLQPGPHLTSTLGRPTLTPEQKRVEAKVNKIFRRQRRRVGSDSLIKIPHEAWQAYAEKLGISKEELKESDSILRYKSRLVVTGQQPFRVIRSSHFISFKCQGEFKALNKVMIDLANCTVHYKRYCLSYAGFFVQPHASDLFGGPLLSGYQFTFNDTGRPFDQPTPPAMTYTKIRLTIYFSAKTGKTAVFFTASKDVKGKSKLSEAAELFFD